MLSRSFREPPQVSSISWMAPIFVLSWVHGVRSRAHLNLNSRRLPIENMHAATTSKFPRPVVSGVRRVRQRVLFATTNDAQTRSGLGHNVVGCVQHLPSEPIARPPRPPRANG